MRHLRKLIYGAALTAVLIPVARAAEVGTPKSEDPPEIRIESGDAVAFLGDSITHEGWAHQAGYVRLVQAGLHANGIEITVIPAGVGGHKSDNMLARLEHDVLSKKPRWMLLSCGVNDVWHGENGVPLEKYKDNMTSMVDQALAAGLKVMLLTPTMIQENPDNQTNKTLKAYIEFLRELAKERNVPIADLNADMWRELDRLRDDKGNAPDKILTRDGVHMRALGDRVMANGILSAFELDSDQLEKAQEQWDSISVPYHYQMDVHISAYDELRLNELTPEARRVMDADLKAEMSKLLKRHAEHGEKYQTFPPRERSLKN